MKALSVSGEGNPHDHHCRLSADLCQAGPESVPAGLASRFCYSVAPVCAMPADAFQWQPPKSWPASLKALFRQPKVDMSLDVFRLPVSTYGTAITPLVRPNGKLARVAFFETLAGGIQSPWGFIHRIGSKLVNGIADPDIDAPAGVHALTLVKAQDGKEGSAPGGGAPTTPRWGTAHYPVARGGDGQAG